MKKTLSWRSILFAVAIYGTVAIAFTLLGISLGPPDSQVGGIRPESTISTHLLGLAGFGLLLGLGGMVVYGRRGYHLVVLMPALTLLLDIDHLPIYLGYAEPIRPAHSLIFIAVALALTAVTIKELEIELAMASAFMGHLAIDTGLFAPLAPFSLQYVQLDPYRILFGVIAALLAISAGVYLRIRPNGAGNA